MKELIEEAFRVAIQSEKNSYDLYRSAAAMIPDLGGELVFERLAREQLKLIDELLKYCPDSFPKTEQTVEAHTRPDGELREPPERRLFSHLRTALQDKHRCIERYATFLDTFRDPALCTLFELVLGMSRKQYKLIAQEYRQADLNLRNKPAVNKRSKRTHIRSGNSPAPNKHSQLFISLQDSGRRSPL